MIKVIKDNKHKKNGKMYFKVTCDQCGSQFAFDSDDAQQFYRKLYDNGIHLHDNRAVQCPI